MPHEMEETGPEVSDVMSENEDEPETFLRDDDKMEQSTTESTTEVKKKYDPKDPLRPRRKKARRACFACQRAHLTCGDERPCQRCIKRGLADACQDGVRKKAKYLHDAPPEALRPVLGPNYNPNPGTRPNGHRQNSSQSDNMSTAGSTFFQGSTASFPVYSTGGQTPVALPDGLPFPTQTSPTAFQGAAPNTQAQMNNIIAGNAMDFNALFDPSNPALYNFDLEGLNFGSQYAGWEFGILNKMALGAETPPRENSLSQTPTTDANYAALFTNGNGSGYDHPMLGADFSGLDHNNQSLYAQGNLQHGLPHAYAIAAGPTSLHSPSTDTTASPHSGAGMDGSPNHANTFAGIPPISTPAPRPRHKHAKGPQSILGKRQRDSSAIYESVKEPYPYTAGFHNMVGVLRRRLPGTKLLKIAKALGEIRPSFISCTKDLTRQDLVFMEKCFQRTLVEYDDFLQHCCAPTVVCRRSGEVAAVNKEFTALTGWTKDVLLGKEPNNNVYDRSADRSANGTPSHDSNSGAEMTTPRLQNATLDSNNGRPQPVFLAELLDDDSVVEFYQDFSQLAFEDSRGKVQRSCGLVKYRTQQSLEPKDPTPHKDPRTSILSNRVTRIDGEHGISRIEKDGKVECTYCWTIKRDVFDIPMMIIINFLPRYYPDQGPQQLAV
ncbi:transcription activator of gluconeogenesis [Thelonectria olida]|uniref:Transcription activator of gluconeogenesis n=1 Tax=Thelonectria olida TaxID=1576542 RepID=A0A9P9ASF4_9HYPO|nr:transcription activator of gluconeogenesis [Thelonectria olida]